MKVRRAVRHALVASSAYLFASAAQAQIAQPPTVFAGDPKSVGDTDQQNGENVLLEGVASSNNVSGTATLVYVWRNAQQQQVSTELRPTVRLADGIHQLSLSVTDNCCSSSSSLTTTSLVTIEVRAPILVPIADAGPDRTIADSDNLPGESVTLQGSGTSTAVSGGGTLSFTWAVGGQQVATGATPTVRLADGANDLTLTVRDNCCSSQGTLVTTDTVRITVTAPASAPVANAGPNRSVADTDRRPGERVTLDGSGSTDADGTIVSYVWSRGGAALGTGRVLQNVELPDGQNTITLTVTDNTNRSSTDTVVIGVGEPLSLPQLSEVAATSRQKQVARALDSLCGKLIAPQIVEGPVVNTKVTAAAAAPEDVADLAARCAGIVFDSSASNQRKALDELGAQEFNAMRTPTVVFSQTQFQSIMDRLVALRAGERGTSVAGLSMRIGEQFVSLEDVAASLRNALGGGASSDENASGGLLSDRLGLWMRGNFGTGEKSRALDGIGFDSDQWGVTGGADYRFGRAAVAGLSIGYGKSSLDFDPTTQGSLDTTSLAASFYGSGYVGGLYLDGVVNYTDTDYESARHISYVEGATAIDRVADGETSGDSLSGGVALGYDITFGGFTLSPNVGYYYVDTTIDEFAERNAGGLNLAFSEQNYKSSAANAGVRMSYAWKTSWGVFIPHFRGAFVREFESSADVFGVRFANDPFASSTDPTPPIIIETTRIDRSYLRLAAGASAQFAFGVSGYFEYQRLEAYEQVSFHDFTVGLRINRGF